MERAVRWAGAAQGVQARTAPQGTERSAGDPGCGRQHSEHSKGRSQRYRLHTDGEQLGAGGVWPGPNHRVGRMCHGQVGSGSHRALWHVKWPGDLQSSVKGSCGRISMCHL